MMPTTPTVDPDDRQLVQTIREGDTDAFETLVRRKTSKVYALCYRIIGNPEDAKDISQLVFIKLWENLAKYDSQYAFDTWLYRMVTNVAIDYMRNKQSRDNATNSNLRLVRTSAEAGARVGRAAQGGRERVQRSLGHALAEAEDDLRDESDGRPSLVGDREDPGMPRVDGAQSPLQRPQDDATAAKEALPRVRPALEATMISCDSFRTRFQASTEDEALLEHIRSCDRCLDFAAGIDPDVMFRALGGEMLPPGGLDAFVDDVMRQVRVRGAESTVARHSGVNWTRRLAIAATLAAGITGAMLFSRWEAHGTHRRSIRT